KYVPDVLYHLVLPTITLSIISIAGLQRRMRANLLDVLNDEYIRTARAKGLPENVVIYKHAVRNALNPMVTLLGFELAGLLSGAAFVEILFSWPGLGQMMLDALLGNDLNLVMAGLLISAIMLLLGNLLSDLLLAFTDPRIKLEA
ncbi:MAG: ABC transporter permease, partial [Candidatus Sericytochromatia bacterium]